MKGDLRIGIGYDIHPMTGGRPLVLGGIRIESDRGLSGHSDADVLLHAICDALLGACGLGDLGEHFPETEEFRDVESRVLLSRVWEMVSSMGYRLCNLDCIIHAEEPKLSPYRDEMIDLIAGLIGAGKGDVSIKATRGEGMGPVGEGMAVAAQAVVLLRKE